MKRTRNPFLERKALPKEPICFSFSTGFLFVKKKKCCVIWWLIIFGMTIKTKKKENFKSA
ncbi:MAG TPA: hypothetical protein C5S37_03040 [Methanophagales archaeon]|nr:hypothetical protein [Methanophagales archaeon]